MKRAEITELGYMLTRGMKEILKVGFPNDANLSYAKQTLAPPSYLPFRVCLCVCVVTQELSNLSAQHRWIFLTLASRGSRGALAFSTPWSRSDVHAAFTWKCGRG